MTNTAITYPLTSQIVKARTYRRKEDGWTNFESNQLNRRLDFLFRMGDYNPYHKKLVSGFVTNHVAIDSGRVMWAAGSDKEYNPFGYSAYYNCSGMLFTNPHDFIRSFSNLFLGCGQGEVIIENLPEFIEYLVGSLEGDQFEFPLINNVFNINFSGYFGEYDFEHPSYTDTTKLYVGENKITIEVGDSREGWASAYNVLLELYTNGVYFLEDKDKYGIPVITYQNTSDFLSTNCINGFDIDIILSSIRPYGTPIKGFGGVANPLYTATFFTNITNILNNAALTQEGQLNTLDISLLLNESAAWCHSGGGRRSAKINQFKQDDPTADAKQGLWQQLPDGSWVVDEKKAALKFSNFTKMYFTKPTYEEVESTVSKQFFCGEGAIQYVPVALARANIDKFDNETEAISTIVNAFETNTQSQLFLEDDYKLRLHRMTRFQLNPCLTGDTLIITKEGIFEIQELVGQEVEIFTGTKWQKVDNFRVTGEDQPIYEVVLASGETIKATPYHTFILENGERVEAHDLTIGDKLRFVNVVFDEKDNLEPTIPGAYVKGFLLGDGTNSKTKLSLSVHPPKYACLDYLLESLKEVQVDADASTNTIQEPGLTNPTERNNYYTVQGLHARKNSLQPWVSSYRQDGIPNFVLNWDKASKAALLSGIFDSDGSACESGHGFSYQLCSISKEFLYSVQKLLKTLNIESKLSLSKSKALRDFGYKGGICETQALYRLSLNQKNSVNLATICSFRRLKSFANKILKYDTKPRWNTVTSINYVGIVDKVYCCTVEGENSFTLANGIVVGNCAEVIGSDFYCNLSSIQFNPLINAYYRLLEEAGTDETESISTLTSLMYEAFYAGGIIAAPLLKHKFADEKFQYSREVDPIVLVSFTELFEFFAWLFGPRWCEWWLAAPPGLTLENDWPLTGRPDTWKVTIEDSDKKYLDRIRELHRWLNDWYFEHAPLVGEDDGSYPQWGPVVDYGVLFRDTEQLLFSFWKNVVFESLQDYCQEHNLTPPNRCTGLKPEGTQTLLTGHSAGWHPPYAKYYIRRITMDPGTAVAQACLALGYEVVPGQTDVDPETGVLLTDPFDSRVKNWLVEVPICVETIPDWFDPSKITALAQYKFWMQVQKYYTTHNTSSTILLKEEEIPVLASQIYHDIAENEPYMSTALLARDETTFPRMPYEVCSKEEFERRYNNIDRTTDFYSLVEKYETHKDSYAGPSGCDSDFCEMK